MKIAVIIMVLILVAAGVGGGLYYIHMLQAKQAHAKVAVAKDTTASKSLHMKSGKGSPAVVAAQTAPALPVAAQPSPKTAKIPKVQAQVQLAADPSGSTPTLPVSSKLTDIYDSMDPDDLAKIFAKQADSEVVSAMQAMDERKAGKVLSALPPDRAAKVASLLARTPAPSQLAGQPPAAGAPAPS